MEKCTRIEDVVPSENGDIPARYVRLQEGRCMLLKVLWKVGMELLCFLGGSVLIFFEVFLSRLQGFWRCQPLNAC